MAGKPDPWEWTTDDVVRELCAENPSWAPPHVRLKLPPLDILELHIRENELDGCSFLGVGSDHPDFFPDLGIKVGKHKETIRYAIAHWRRQSPMYKVDRIRQQQEDDSDAAVNSATANGPRPIDAPNIESSRRKLDEERKGDSDHSTYVTPEPVIPGSDSHTPATTPNLAVSALPGATALTPAKNKNTTEPTAPPSKRRRIVPTTLSAEQSADVVRNIHSTDPAAIASHMTGSYLGAQPFNRADILEFSFDSEPLDDEEETFVFLAKPESYGRRRQRSVLLKRYLAGGWESRLQTAKKDMIPGGKDPEHYHVLPAYGDSDDEYDSDTWKEILKEEEDRKKVEERKKVKASKGLTDDQKHEVIDRIIAEREQFWAEHKLPGLQSKAYGIWTDARRQGLRHAIAWQEHELQSFQERLTQYAEGVVDDHWSNEAEIRKISGNFEPTVDIIQQTLWKIKVIKSPSEPQKPPRTLRSKKRQNPRMEGDDEDEEVLTSSSETEDAGLDDEGIVAPDGEEMDITDSDVEDGDIAVQDFDEMIIDDDGLPHFHGIGVMNDRSGQSIAATSGESRTQVDDLSEPLLELPTPSISQSDDDSADESEHAQGRSKPSSAATTPKRNPSSSKLELEPEMIDLTQPARSPSIDMDANGVTPKSRNVISLITPPPRAAYSSRKILQLSPIQWEKLTENQRAVWGEIELLQPPFQTRVLDFALLPNTEKLFKDFVVPALDAKILPVPDLTTLSEEKQFKTVKSQDDFHGLLLARLFDIFIGNKKTLWKEWFRVLSNGGKQRIKDQEAQFASFIHLVRQIGLTYRRDPLQAHADPVHRPPLSSGVKKTTMNGNSAKPKIGGNVDDTDKSNPDVTDSEDDYKGKGKTKAKKVIVRDKAAQDLRESDQRRLREQEARRQAMINKLALMEGSAASQMSRLIVNDSKRDDQPFIYVPDNIAPYIKDHQVAGVRFMWNQITDTTEAQGCLLAHTMGLGKTMQVITLLATISESSLSEDPAVSAQIPKHLKVSRTLILCPPGISSNWLDELLMWTGQSAHGLGSFYKIDSQNTLPERVKMVEQWAEGPGVLILGYQMFCKLLDNTTVAPLLLEKPSLVVADEAHLLKNSKSKVHQKALLFETHTRIALTGSPLANNVLEYHAMINWVAPNYLSDEGEFRLVYATPIEHGLSMKSSPYDRRKALVKLRSLKDTVAPKVHRRTIHALKDQIPPKTEFVIAVELTELQRRAYEVMVCSRGKNMATDTVTLFSLMNVLSLLCNHPACFRTRLTQEKKGEQVEDSLTKNGIMSQEVISNVLQLMPSDSVNGTDGEKLAWKVVILLRILEECQKRGESVLVFSHSILTLDYLEQTLRRHKIQTDRLDGNTVIHHRQGMVKAFNRSEFGVFLISTTAGGVGLNITGASRVVIFDSKFNPQHEQQGIGRAYRLGQEKPVFVYRFVCAESYEEKLLARSVFKLQLASRVVDQKNPIPKGISFNEQLFFEKPNDPQKCDLTQAKGKDVILDSVLKSSAADGICSIMLAETFEEEDLENEQLTQEEQKEAQELTISLNRRGPRPSVNDFHVQRAIAQGKMAAGTRGPSATPRPSVIPVPSATPAPLAAPAPSEVPVPSGPAAVPKPPLVIPSASTTPSLSATPGTSATPKPLSTMPRPPQARESATLAPAPAHGHAEETRAKSPAQPDGVAPVPGVTTQFRPPRSAQNGLVVSSVETTAQDQPEDRAVPPANNEQGGVGSANTRSQDAQQARKSHKEDDLAALMEFRRLGETRSQEPRQPNRAKEAVVSQGRATTSEQPRARLPNWAKEAVVSRGRATPSASASPWPSSSSRRRARDPFM